jgi:hypothetical protein
MPPLYHPDAEDAKTPGHSRRSTFCSGGAGRLPANRQAVIQQAVERSEVLDMARLALTLDRPSYGGLALRPTYVRVTCLVMPCRLSPRRRRKPRRPVLASPVERLPALLRSWRTFVGIAGGSHSKDRGAPALPYDLRSFVFRDPGGPAPVLTGSSPLRCGGISPISPAPTTRKEKGTASHT